MKRLPILLILMYSLTCNFGIIAKAQKIRPTTHICATTADENFMKQLNEICTRKKPAEKYSYYSLARKNNKWIEVYLIENHTATHFIDTLSTAKVFAVYACSRLSKDHFRLKYNGNIYYFSSYNHENLAELTKFIKPTNNTITVNYDYSTLNWFDYEPLFTVIYEDGKLSEPEYDPEKIYFLTE